MLKHLRDQVEKIIDEATDPTINVIVQMTTPDEELDDILKTASEAMERRRVTVSARDLLPAPADELEKAKGKKTTAAAKRHLAEWNQSLSTTMAQSSLSDTTPAKLKTIANRVLKPLFTSSFVESIVGGLDAIKKASEKIQKVSDAMPHFWSSGSAVMEVKKDQLHRLPEEVPEIADIYPNRVVTVAPVVEIKEDPEGLRAAENHISTWGLQTTGALAAWGAFGVRGKGVKVAVLDTGVDATHPDLKDRVVGFAELDAQGRNITNGKKSYDSKEHGTHCAGTIAGGNASGRWIGMAPEAEILSALVLKNGKGTDAQILAGMQWAMENGADIVSMSLGGLRLTPDVLDTYTRTIINATRLGIPVIVSIGNEGHQTSGSPGNDFFALGVGATSIDDRPAGFSGGRAQVITSSRFIAEKYLPLVYRKPDVSAPGVAVYSCIPGNKYASWNGTSMAAPHVAGAAALLLSGTTIREVPKKKRAFLIQDLLTATAEELGESGQDQRYGFGRIDVLRAIGHAKHLGY